MSTSSSHLDTSPLLISSAKTHDMESVSPIAESHCPYQSLKQKQLQTSSLDTLCQAAKTILDKEPQAQLDITTTDTYGLFDIWNNEESTVIYMDAPGLKKENIEITVKDDHLYVNAIRESNIDANEQYIYSERYNKTIKQSILLPACVDVNTITSAYKDGVIIITLRKIVPKNHIVRKIPVESNVCSKQYGISYLMPLNLITVLHNWPTRSHMHPVKRWLPPSF